MAADKTAAAQDAPKQPRRSISAKLKPVSGVAAKAAAKAGPVAGETPAAPAPEAGKPTDDQIAIWRALEPNQKLALREREALGSTGFGRAVAIPHARLETIDRPLAIQNPVPRRAR